MTEFELQTHPAGQRGSSWSWAARNWAEGAGVGAGSQEVAHFEACSRNSRNPQARPLQPRQYPPWARSPLKRPPPAHLRSLTTQTRVTIYHRHTSPSLRFWLFNWPSNHVCLRAFVKQTTNHSSPSPPTNFTSFETKDG